MNLFISIPAHKHQAIGKIYLNDLLWGTELNSPALLNLNSFEMAWLKTNNLTSGYIPVLALFAEDKNLDTFNFRKWCEDNYPRFEKTNNLEEFEDAQMDIYYKTLDESIIYQQKELNINLELIHQNWAEGVYNLKGL